MIGKTGNPNHTQTGGGAFYSVADTNELLKSAGGGGDSGGGDSGGGNVFVITAIIGQGGAVSLDRTPNEVLTAIENGSQVETHVFDDINAYYVLPLTFYNISNIEYTCSAMHAIGSTEDGVAVMIMGVTDSADPNFGPYFYYRRTTIY